MRGERRVWKAAAQLNLELQPHSRRGTIDCKPGGSGDEQSMPGCRASQAAAGPTLRLSYTPAFFSTSAQMGTVELTGLLRGGSTGRGGRHELGERQAVMNLTHTQNCELQPSKASHNGMTSERAKQEGAKKHGLAGPRLAPT